MWPVRVVIELSYCRRQCVGRIAAAVCLETFLFAAWVVTARAAAQEESKEQPADGGGRLVRDASYDA